MSPLNGGEKRVCLSAIVSVAHGLEGKVNALAEVSTDKSFIFE